MPMLSISKGIQVFVIYSDASKNGLGCVLMQQENKELNMSQRRWLELVKDYDCEIYYYSSKERLCIQDLEVLEKEILEEAHSAPYSVYTRSTKMYQDIKLMFWWRGMKKDIAMYVERFPEINKESGGSFMVYQFQLYRIETQEFSGHLEKHLPLIESAYNNSYHTSINMAPYEALYRRKCRLLVYWDEFGEHKILGLEIIEQTVQAIKKIRNSIKMAEDKLKAM
ncbi:uncharacterized protein LOC111379842 [Olea europaea var. sylvestris]|uniref:uncharacterized protein LOC111379842 n=1 Tax=Olea europaea var. sylvestris TaxID=158386 RepID=UPI000C1CE55B|nr:uncharacterized protein LOC111379842 [Olea europaea var. sylvestris]